MTTHNDEQIIAKHETNLADALELAATTYDSQHSPEIAFTYRQRANHLREQAGKRAPGPVVEDAGDTLSPTEVICYVPGTVANKSIKGRVQAGEFTAVFPIHPDGTPKENRRWVRTKGDLAYWTTKHLMEGARILAVGSPSLSTDARRKNGGKSLWMIDATRILIDQANTLETS